LAGRSQGRALEPSDQLDRLHRPGRRQDGDDGRHLFILNAVEALDALGWREIVEADRASRREAKADES
jgi:hypothetical protein